LRSTAAALLALSLIAPAVSAAPCVWFADASSIKQLNTADNSVSVEVALGNPRRLVMNDDDCSVWALRRSNGRLLKYDETGAQVRNVNVTQLEPAIPEVLRVRLDPFDNSLWVTGERRIAHLNTDASALLASFNAPAEIRRFGIGLDQKLWVLGKRKLWRFNRQGTLMEERLLDPVLQGEARNFAVDELRQTIWIAGDNQIARLDTGGSGAATVVAQFEDGISAFTLDPVTGRAWFARPGFLVALNPDGSLLEPIPLGQLELPGSIHKLAFDPASRSLFAGFNGVLARFSTDGEFLGRLSADDYDDEAIGVPPFRVKPRVTLEQPPEGGLVNRRRPTFELRYGARCNGSDCDVPPAYLPTLQIEATLNGNQAGGEFEFNASTLIASFRPANPLPQGPFTFTARLTDLYGHKSNLISTTITVDSIAPEFGPIKPPAGSVHADPQVRLRGSINEAGASVFLENAQANFPQGPNPQQPQPPNLRFQWDLTLQPGDNPIQLSAIDAAGNVTTRSHLLVFSGTGGGGTPAAAIQAPANGAIVGDDNIVVSGTWSGPVGSGVAVNGVIAGTSGNQFFATVPLVPGTNTLTVTVSGTEGPLAANSIQVTSTGATPTRVTASTLRGVAPLTVSFTISSDQTITMILGEFRPGFGIFVNPFAGAPLTHTYDQPGVYTPYFNVVRADGTTQTKQLQIVVQSVQDVDQQLTQVWNGLAGALTRGDKTAAMQYISSNSRAKYGAAFDALLPSLPQIVASFSTPQPASIGADVGEYAVNRTINGVNRLFFIYFLREADGVWRVDSM
jgi:PKD repeat protein